MKAKIVNRYSIEVIDFELEKRKIFKAKEQFIKDLSKDVSDDKTRSLIEKKASDYENEELKRLEEYKNFLPSEYKGEKIREIDSLRPYYELESDVIVQKWEVVKNDENKIRGKIKRLKTLLESSDYKVIKCYENTILGKEVSEKDKAVIAERNGWRIEINKLEDLLKNNSK